MTGGSASGPAPFFADIAGAPDGARALWARAADGVRLRIGLLAAPAAEARGTVLLFTGRSEYVEKYGPAARALAGHGYACLAIDWRGQGLADRPAGDPATGHVAHFADYQRDVAALLESVAELGLPRPFFLLAHSMGACIGLRALHEGLPVAAAVFSAPMWNIAMPAALRLPARLLAGLVHGVGLGARRIPFTGSLAYVTTADFDDNALTGDRVMFDWMRHQLRAHPELVLGGPSFAWFREALREVESFRDRPLPELPCLTWMGTGERLVDSATIRRMMAAWPGSELTVIEGARHEVMMEGPEIRNGFIDAACALYDDVARPG